MDGVLRTKQSDKYSELRRKRRMKVILGVSLCIGMMIIVLNTPIKARLKARLNLFLTKMEAYTMNGEDQIPQINYFKLSVIEADGKAKETDTANQYEYVTKRKRDLYKGSLQLINGSHAYLFRETEQLVDVKANKNKSYKLLERKMKLNKDMIHALNAMMEDFEKATGKHDMIMTSGYRTLADQGEVLQEKINLWGENEALEWAMLPGYSEHHSGYAVDMSIIQMKETI